MTVGMKCSSVVCKIRTYCSVGWTTLSQPNGPKFKPENWVYAAWYRRQMGVFCSQIRPRIECGCSRRWLEDYESPAWSPSPRSRPPPTFSPCFLQNVVISIIQKIKTHSSDQLWQPPTLWAPSALSPVEWRFLSRRCRRVPGWARPISGVLSEF